MASAGCWLVNAAPRAGNTPQIAARTARVGVADSNGAGTSSGNSVGSGDMSCKRTAVPSHSGAIGRYPGASGARQDSLNLWCGRRRQSSRTRHAASRLRAAAAGAFGTCCSPPSVDGSRPGWRSHSAPATLPISPFDANRRRGLARPALLGAAAACWWPGAPAGSRGGAAAVCRIARLQCRTARHMAGAALVPLPRGAVFVQGVARSVEALPAGGRRVTVDRRPARRRARRRWRGWCGCDCATPTRR